MSPLTQSDVLALEAFCLARLSRFARLASQPDAEDTPAWRQLARHATLSAYRDCLALGLGAEARRVLASAGRGDRAG
jgi:Ser/Thr protein kinase RdoA (MazF antagonist)